MKTVLALFRGDRVLWGIIALLAIFSFLPVYSSSTNLAYVIGKGTPTGYLIKHLIIMILGFGLLIAIHRIPYHYFRDFHTHASSSGNTAALHHRSRDYY